MACSAPTSESPPAFPYRIKRKPAPTIPIEERYPPNDPSDPFAPLTELRSRYSPSVYTPSTPDWSLQEQETFLSVKPTYTLYAIPPPDQSSPFTCASDSESESPARPNFQRTSHYRTRAHSVAAMSSPEIALALPSGRDFTEARPVSPGVLYSIADRRSFSEERISPTPSLIQEYSSHSDSSSDVDEALPSPTDAVCSEDGGKHTAGKRLQRFMLSRKKSTPNLIPFALPGASASSSKAKRRSSISTPLIIHGGSPSSGSPSPTSISRTNSFRGRHGQSVLEQTLAKLSGLEPNHNVQTTSGADSMTAAKIFALRKNRRECSWSDPSDSVHHLQFLGESVAKRLSSSSSRSAKSSSTRESVGGSPLRNRVDLPLQEETQPQASTSQAAPAAAQESSAPSIAPVAPGTENFSSDSPPTISQLRLAACIPVIDVSGNRVQFGSLFEGRQLCVIFVRHWTSSSCHSYVKQAVADFRAWEKSRCDAGNSDEEVQMVVVGNGSHTLIERYRQACSIPDAIAVYTEPSLRIHRAFGMGTTNEKEKEEPALDDILSHSVPPKEKKGMVGGLAKSVVRALKTNVTVNVANGPISQLGGEFLLGPELECSYARTMKSGKDRAPIGNMLVVLRVSSSPPSADEDALAVLSQPASEKSDLEESSWTKDIPSTPPDEALDVVAPLTHSSSCSPRTSYFPEEFEAFTDPQGTMKSTFSDMSESEQQEWMEQRAQLLERMKVRKIKRRAVPSFDVKLDEEGEEGTS